MRIRVDLNPDIRKQAVVCILRDQKGRVSYNSGLLYFKFQSSIDIFKEKVLQTNPSMEVHLVDIKDAHSSEVPGDGYWCPYCQNWEYWPTDVYGNKKCPICGVSSNEYYVKMMNHLWTTKMKSKSAKKRVDRLKGGNE